MDRGSWISPLSWKGECGFAHVHLRLSCPLCMGLHDAKVGFKKLITWRPFQNHQEVSLPRHRMCCTRDLVAGMATCATWRGSAGGPVVHDEPAFPVTVLSSIIDTGRHGTSQEHQRYRHMLVPFSARTFVSSKNLARPTGMLARPRRISTSTCLASLRNDDSCLLEQ